MNENEIEEKILDDKKLVPPKWNETISISRGGPGISNIVENEWNETTNDMEHKISKALNRRLLIFVCLLIYFSVWGLCAFLFGYYGFICFAIGSTMSSLCDIFINKILK